MDFLFRCVIPFQTSASGSGLYLWIRSLTMFLDFFVCLTESQVAQDGLELTMYWISGLSASTSQVLVMEPSDLCMLGKYSTELKFFLLKKTKYLYKNILNHWTSSEILKRVCMYVCHTHAHQESSPGPYTCQTISTTEPQPPETPWPSGTNAWTMATRKFFSKASKIGESVNLAQQVLISSSIKKDKESQVWWAWLLYYDLGGWGKETATSLERPRISEQDLQCYADGLVQRQICGQDTSPRKGLQIPHKYSSECACESLTIVDTLCSISSVLWHTSYLVCG